MGDKSGEEKGMTFFESIGKEVVLTPDQEKAVADLRKEGMGEEMKGLPIIYPQIAMLHQGTAAFRFVETEDVKKTFNAVFIYVEPSRVWWQTKYGAAGAEGGDGFPKCYSRDLIAPDPRSEMPQSEKCGTCAQYQWGSDVKADGSQGRGRSCKEVRRIFLMVEGHISPHWMTIPPSSLKTLSSYFVNVRDKGFMKPQEVVTKFSLSNVENKDGVSYSELSLALEGALPVAVVAMVADWKKRISEMLENAVPVSKEDYEGRPDGKK